MGIVLKWPEYPSTDYGSYSNEGPWKKFPYSENCNLGQIPHPCMMVRRQIVNIGFEIDYSLSKSSALVTAPRYIYIYIYIIHMYAYT